MNDTIEIPVTYKNQELTFKAHIVRFGYVQHIIVDLEGDHITIERDEEGNYRALVDPQMFDNNKLDKELIRTIVGVLEAI